MPTLATLPPSPLTLCLLGTGNMGLPMARRLAQAGYPMRVWNRTQAKAEVLAADGAVICATPRQACSGADITLSLLENGDVVEQVLFGLGADSACHGLASGSLVIDMASIQPRQARAHAQRLQAQGVRHLDAPVSGGTVGAEAGTLAIMVGGDVEDAAQAAPVFEGFWRTPRLAAVAAVKVQGTAARAGNDIATQACRRRSASQPLQARPTTRGMARLPVR